FVGANPPQGALLTYYIADIPKTSAQQRKEKEEELSKQAVDIPFPGWDELKSESLEQKPQVLILITNEAGQAMRWLEGNTSEGVHRINWDLRMSPPDPISLSKPSFLPPWAGSPQGPLVAPGVYKAHLYMVNNGNLTSQGEERTFQVKPTPAVKSDINYEELVAFTQATADLSRRVGAAGNKLSEANNILRHIEAAILQTPDLNPEFFEQLKALKTQLTGLREDLYGDAIRRGKNEPNEPYVSGRVGYVVYGHWRTTQMPTQTQMRNVEWATEQFEEFLQGFSAFTAVLSKMEKALEKAGAPYTPGRKIE
ncbi:MAG: glycosyl hydrolase, partial [Fulvivirga sp.]|nr:glycosyl hydrolase [Fulvivirga sp.]